MKMSPSEEDLKSIAPIMEPISLSMALVNDFFSWDKEYQNYLENGCKDKLYSSVKILMDEHSISPEEAKEMVKEKIVAYEKEFTKLKEGWLAGTDRPSHLRKYLETTGFMASGSCYWHSEAPRYHEAASAGSRLFAPTLKDFDAKSQGHSSNTSLDDTFSNSQRSSVTSSLDGVGEHFLETVNGILNSHDNSSKEMGLKRQSDETDPAPKRRQTQANGGNRETEKISFLPAPKGEMSVSSSNSPKPYKKLMSVPKVCPRSI